MSGQGPTGTVLIVDDDHELRECLSELLESAGHRVLTACNGLEGLTAARQLSGRAVILLDLNMPLLNGHDMLQRLREDPALRRIPVVVVTAEPDEVPAGISVLRKPFDAAALFEVVDQTCDHAAAG